MKAGLKRTYSGVSQELLDVTNVPQWKPLLYAVAFLHTTVQVRPLKFYNLLYASLILSSVQTDIFPVPVCDRYMNWA